MLGGNEANAPGAEGFAHKPRQSRDEEANGFYGVSFGEAQLIPRCSSVILGGDAPAFDWETKAKKREFKWDPCEKLLAGKELGKERPWSQLERAASLSPKIYWDLGSSSLAFLLEKWIIIQNKRGTDKLHTSASCSLEGDWK